MILQNRTKFEAGYTVGSQPDGREVLVTVIKATFQFPESGQAPLLAEEQAPLIMSDELTGEPGFSATLYENDFATRKPRCDILLNGTAHAPGGKPATQFPVALRVGSWSKSFQVVGPRKWKAGLLYYNRTNPEPFTQMPISYNNAWGGVDRSQEDPAKHRWFPTNHAGVGYHEYLDAKALNDQPLPNTEETGQAISKPQGNYRPMAFGPVGRSWQPRIKWAGTYDQNWVDNVLPFLPKDFDERYFQAAPEDQQTDYLRGGEEVELTNLTPQGHKAFRLPKLQPFVVYYFRDGSERENVPVLDTLLFEPDAGRFMMVWRAPLILRKNIFEVPVMDIRLRS